MKLENNFKLNEMTVVQTIQGLREIADDYDAFIIDLWGVIHDGIAIFPPILEVLEQLKQTKKHVCLMTNNPKSNQDNINKLAAMGLNPELYTELISAGQQGIEMILDPTFLSHQERPLKAMVIEEGLTCNWTDLAQIERVDSLHQADFILGFHIFENNLDMTVYKPLLTQALAQNIPFFCVNPDLYATRNNERFARVGLLAKTYERIGGQVFYAGKPSSSIYENTIKNHGHKQILMIGDSLVTDIKGANENGFDGLLISSGNHNHELSQIHPKDLPTFFHQKGIMPNFLCPHLVW